jgi:hypothetical protein
MEKIKVLLIIGLFISISSAMNVSIANAKETYMSAEQAKNKFGEKTFSPDKFKAADRKLRGEMAADLILKKIFIGKPLKSAIELLGPPDGYFENDGIPAYLISSDLNKKDTWQLIFLPDKDWKKIDEIKIHKNCCE